jgi:hypothetical protein
MVEISSICSVFFFSIICLCIFVVLQSLNYSLYTNFMSCIILSKFQFSVCLFVFLLSAYLLSCPLSPFLF